jgi:hypothetical protein
LDADAYIQWVDGHMVHGGHMHGGHIQVVLRVLVSPKYLLHSCCLYQGAMLLPLVMLLLVTLGWAGCHGNADCAVPHTCSA